MLVLVLISWCTWELSCPHFLSLCTTSAAQGSQGIQLRSPVMEGNMHWDLCWFLAAHSQCEAVSLMDFVSNTGLLFFFQVLNELFF